MMTSIPKGQGLRPPPCPEEIRAQVARIVASAEFPKIGRGTTFLRYVIEEVLEGRSNRIKGYSVAVEVFKRAEGFTQDDPVVRIEAGRLRRSLERYYLVAGEHDPIRITIPKGGYVPHFDWILSREVEITSLLDVETINAPPQISSKPKRWPQFAVASGIVILLIVLGAFAVQEYQRAFNTVEYAVRIPDGPTLAVAPFGDMGDGTDAKHFAEGLTEDLLTALPRFKDLKVFGREASSRLAPDARASDVGQQIGARYLLAGGVRIDMDTIRVTARLSDTDSNKILWSATYDEDRRARSLFAIQTEVANRVATIVAQPYGIIALSAAANPSTRGLSSYDCTTRFYQYVSEMSPEQHSSVRACLESAVQRYPAYGAAWAMLSILYLDEERFAFNNRNQSDRPVRRALDTARKAVQLDPENSRALQALMMALFFNQQVVDGIRVGEQALLANPNDTHVMSEFGTRLAMSGDWRRGADLLREALARNPGAAGYYHAVLGLSAYMQNDLQSAVSEIEQADLQKQPLYHIVAAVIYAEVARMDEATREAEMFSKTRPDFISNIYAELTLRNMLPLDQKRLVEGIRKVGITVPNAR